MTAGVAQIGRLDAVSADQRADADPEPQFSWPAWLDIGLTGGDRGTRLVRSGHCGPLYVQKPFYPEGRDVAHIYLLHPPAGLVSGDQLRVSVQTNRDAQLLLTAPGAGKAYRARSERALQQQHIEINAQSGSAVEWLPHETIIFDGARVVLDTCVKLASGGAYIGWDILCLGRKAGNQPFSTGSVEQRLRLFRNDRLALVDKLRVTGENGLLDATCGLNGCTTYGYVVMAAGKPDLDMTGLTGILRQCITELEASERVAITAWKGLCIARYLGHCSAEAKQLFTRLWQRARPLLLGREACIPRIWYT